MEKYFGIKLIYNILEMLSLDDNSIYTYIILIVTFLQYLFAHTYFLG